MTSSSPDISPRARVILLGSVFVIAACGLVYELVAGAVSSYLLGDAVTQFSLVIGVFLCAMGIGSYLSKFITGHLLKTFVELEIWLGLIGGCSSIAMFAVSAYADPLFPVFFYSLCATMGIFIGIEIPLLIRILNETGGFSEALSHVLAIDYVGALAGALLFPFIVLPYVGLSRASVIFGLLNLGVAAVGIRLLPDKRQFITFKLIVATFLLITTLFYSTRLVGFLEDILYQDEIIYTETTPYQRIVVTRWRDDIRLFLNGHIQFCSIDEARYHESLIIPAMEACPGARDVLILGGGDGMASREVLKYDSVQHIDLVDLDPAMTDLGQNRTEFVMLNQNALNSPKVFIHNTDAMRFLEATPDFFDIIIVDLPDPNSEALSKLYSNSFYALCARRLRADGVLVTQATSPYYAPEAFWCIANTIEAAVAHQPDVAGLTAMPYHVNVPSFGEWGFIIGTRQEFDVNALTVSVPTRFHTSESMRIMFVFSRDMQPKKDLGINTLEHPVLFNYYQHGWGKFNY